MLDSRKYMVLAAGLAIALSSLSDPAAAATARGTVFEDTNGNGLKDADEPGIAGVAVSNGRDVVRTNADGGYRLDLREEEILFITKPRDYAVPVDENNLPQFYYVHQPEGTPAAVKLRYEGLRPTGPLPDTIDFPLIPSPEPDTFKVILFADTQPQTFKELEFIRDDVVSELIGTEAAFGLTAGDIMFDDLSMFPRYNKIIGQIGVPWYNVAGNHELNFESPNEKYSLETFKRFFGPANYSFDYGNAHFVVMDDVFYLGKNKGRDDNPHPRGAGGYEGRLTPEQLRWLRKDLALVPKDKLVVLAMHIPLLFPIDPEAKGVNVVNRADLFEVLKDRPHVISLAGHTHTNEILEFGEEDGFPQDRPLHHHTITTVSGSWWSGPRDARGIPQSLQSDGVPNGYFIMEVNGNSAKLRYKAAGLPSDYQMRISLDSDFHNYSSASIRDYHHGELLKSPISVDQLFATDVIVNVFNGGPKSQVSYTIAGREPVVMERTFMPSPMSRQMIARHKDDYKSWVRAGNSGHIWKARLPADLTPGTYTMTVTATDGYGAEHTAHSVIEIVGHGD